MKQLLALATERLTTVTGRVRPGTCPAGHPVTALAYVDTRATAATARWSVIDAIAMAPFAKSVNFHDQRPLPSTL